AYDEPITDQTPLLPGDSYTINRRIRVPAALQPGDRELIVRADVNNQQAENDDTNNEMAAPIRISAPDLIVTDSTAPASAAPRGPFPVSWTVKNIGTVPAYGDWSDQVIFSWLTILSQPTGDNTPLAPGASYTINTTATVPTWWGGGSFTIRVHADGNGDQ